MIVSISRSPESRLHGPCWLLPALTLLAVLSCRSAPAWAAEQTAAETQLQAARAARRVDRYNSAERHLREYLKRGGSLNTAKLERALIQAQQGEIAPVKQFLHSFLEKKDQPEALLVLEALTRGSLDTYRFADANSYLTLWLKRGPKDVQALLFSAKLKALTDDVSGAVNTYRQLLQIQPEQADARQRLAELLLALLHVKEAAKQYEYLRKKQPNNPAILVGLASCQVALGQYSAARQLLDDLLKKHPRHAAALRERGKLALEEGKAADAEAWLRKALKRDPQDVVAMYSLLKCLRQLGRNEEAKQVLGQYKLLQSDFNRMGALFRAVAKSPDDPKPRSEVGLLCLRLGKDKQGLSWLQSALKADPGHRPTHKALAEYYEKTGQKELAERHRRLARD